MVRHYLILLIFFASISGAASEQTASPQVTLLTEENHPHSVRNSKTGKIEGVAVDIILSLMDQTNTKYTLEILPWNRAFRRAQNEENTCIFATNRIPEREKMFQWVSPTHVGGWALYQRPESKFTIETLDDLKALAIVGRHRNPASDQLEAAIQNKILRTESNEDAAVLLYRGRADLWISGVYDGPAATEKAGLPSPKMALHWKKSTFGLACSHRTDENLIKALNEANAKRLKSAHPFS